MAAEQGIKTLKITGCNKISIFPADWIAGVDYEDNGDEENQEYDEEEEYLNDEPHQESAEDLDDEEAYDGIDQEEIDDLKT